MEGLSLLSCTKSGPVWPDHLDAKFKAHSPEAKEIAELKKAFLADFPASVTAPAAPGAATVRVTGQPDFSLDGGREPIDVARVVDLLVEAPPGPANRTGL